MTTLILFILVILAIWNSYLTIQFHGLKAVKAETEELVAKARSILK
jgi:hypothetical protein